MISRSQSASVTASPSASAPPGPSPFAAPVRASSTVSTGPTSSPLASAPNFLTFAKAAGKFLSHLRHNEDDEFGDDFDMNETEPAVTARMPRQSTITTGHLRVLLQILNSSISHAETTAAIAAQRGAWIANLQETFKALFSPAKNVVITVEPIDHGYDISIQYSPNGRYVAADEVETFAYERVWGHLHPDRVGNVAFVEEEMV